MQLYIILYYKMNMTFEYYVINIYINANYCNNIYNIYNIYFKIYVIGCNIYIYYLVLFQKGK